MKKGGLLILMIVKCSFVLYAQPLSKSKSFNSIKVILLDKNDIIKYDSTNGDTYDPFWAYNDSLYAAGCDGNGFGRKKPHRNINFNIISGDSIHKLIGHWVNGMEEYGKAGQSRADSANWKACGQECIDSVFYIFVSRNKYGHKSGDKLLRQTAFNSSLIKSTDKGLSWSRNESDNYTTPMWEGKDFSSPFFVHYGKNGGNVTKDNADKYVYAISNNGFWNGGDYYIIGRVPRAKLKNLNSKDWTYFKGGNGEKNKNWSSKITEAYHLLGLPAHCGQTGATYIPALKKYLLVAWYITDTLKSWFNPKEIKYDFYQADHPWGDWTLVSSFSDNFMEDRHWYGPSIMTKFQEKTEEGAKVYMVTSGCGPFSDVPKSMYKMWEVPLILKTVDLDSSELINDNDPSIIYSAGWDTFINKKLNDYQKDIHESKSINDSLIYAFKGTGIEYLAAKKENFGTADIFIDGVFKQSVNLSITNLPRLSQVVVYGVNHLKRGVHHIKIVNSLDKEINIDAFRVYK